jgi:hypothetical protein
MYLLLDGAWRLLLGRLLSVVELQTAVILITLPCNVEAEFSPPKTQEGFQ